MSVEAPIKSISVLLSQNEFRPAEELPGLYDYTSHVCYMYRLDHALGKHWRRSHITYLDVVCVFVEVDVPQHHAARKEDSSRVGQILASNVRRCAVHCLHKRKPIRTCDRRSTGNAFF